MVPHDERAPRGRGRGGKEGGSEDGPSPGDGPPGSPGAQAGDDPPSARDAGFAGLVPTPPVMTAGSVQVHEDTTAAEAAVLMDRLDVGCLAVVDRQEGKHLRGMVTDRDLALRILGAGHSPDTPVATVMSPTAYSCGTSDRIQQVLETMRTHRIPRVPIVDENGWVVGLIALADAAIGRAAPGTTPAGGAPSAGGRRRRGRPRPGAGRVTDAGEDHAGRGFVIGRSPSGSDVGLRAPAGLERDEW